MASPLPLDRLGRPLGVLRLSLTARCNLACPYCLPDGQEPPGLLSLDQRLAVIRAAVALGVRSLRLTGGEPLLHAGLEELIAAAATLRDRERAPADQPSGSGWPAQRSHNALGEADGAPSSTERPGLAEIALTSNGTLLSAARARALRAAGLDRISLSLDGADAASVARMAGLADADAGERMLQRVLAAIEHARNAGFDPARGQLKLNAVIQPGRNDDQLLPLAALARERGVELRLIEFMDVGNRNGWHPEGVLSAAAMLERIGQRWPLERLGRPPHSTAGHWRYRDADATCGKPGDRGGAALAVIASVSAPFCGDCNRLRVTADGIAYPCLFASPERGLDLRPWLGPDGRPEALQEAIRSLWQQRDDRWSEERLEAWNARGGRKEGGADSPRPSRAEMAYLGG